jgi:hypothetical protein
MLRWYGIGEEDDNDIKLEVLRIILLASCPNRIISRQHDSYAQDESCCV